MWFGTRPGWSIYIQQAHWFSAKSSDFFTLRHIFQIIWAYCVSSCLIRLAVISQFSGEFFRTICFVFRPSCRSFWWLVQISWNEVGNNSGSFGIKIVTKMFINIITKFIINDQMPGLPSQRSFATLATMDLSFQPIRSYQVGRYVSVTANLI